jgi:hypothetical protein
MRMIAGEPCEVELEVAAANNMGDPSIDRP